jgi:hypothetical protein
LSHWWPRRFAYPASTRRAFAQSAIEVSPFGQRVPVISLDDLIAAKEAVGREKDILAVKELRAIKAKRGVP